MRLVCAAICLFSSSVGYGCWKKEGGCTISVFVQIRASVLLLNEGRLLLKQIILLPRPCFMLDYSLPSFFVQHISATRQFQGLYTILISSDSTAATSKQFLSKKKNKKKKLMDADVKAHHEMLEEPGTHDVGGVFGQDPSLVL